MSNNNYKSFSVRHGYKQPKPIQREAMDKDLRNGLWNAFYNFFPIRHINFNEFISHEIFEDIWTKFFKNRTDEYNEYAIEENKEFVEKIFFSSPWNEVYDLIDFVISYIDTKDTRNRNIFIKPCNQVLERENSAYRIVDGLVTEIVSGQEIESIETAMATPYQNANKHIKNALTAFSRRENPDYANSIKESISAVESIAQEITGKEKSLNALTQELPIHPNFQNGLKELYNWTSTDGGIRHARNDKTLSPSKNTARFMLVTCSAFVNYIVSEMEQSKND